MGRTAGEGRDGHQTGGGRGAQPGRAEELQDLGPHALDGRAAGRGAERDQGDDEDALDQRREDGQEIGDDGEAGDHLDHGGHGGGDRDAAAGAEAGDDALSEGVLEVGIPLEHDH